MAAAEELVVDRIMAEGEGAGGGDAAAVLETPADEGDGGEGEGGEGHQQQDPAKQAEGKSGDGKAGEGKKLDGRNTPDAIRKHLAQLKGNPETAAVAKAINDRVGKVRGYEEVYPTVREAREVKALIDSVGGREAVTQAIASHATMQRVDSLIEAGDPAVLEDIFEQAPEGMLKLVPAILDKVQTMNPEAWQKAITPHAVTLLGNAGLPGAINALVDAFEKDQKPAMQEILSRIVRWYSGLMDGAKPKSGQVDPKFKALEDENRKLKDDGAAAATKAAFDSTTGYAGKKIDTEVAPTVRKYGMTAEATEDFRQAVWKEVQRVRNSDAVYKNGLPSKFEGKRAKPEAVDFINGYTDRLMAAAVQTVTRDWEKKGFLKAPVPAKNVTAPKGGSKQAGAGGGKTVEGALKIAGPPDRKDIDYDDKRTDVFKGVAVRKSDKRLVYWR